MIIEILIKNYFINENNVNIIRNNISEVFSKIVDIRFETIHLFSNFCNIFYNLLVIFKIFVSFLFLLDPLSSLFYNY